MKKAVITVLGTDCLGITMNVSEILVKANINILDISQTILDNYFNMVMVVDITESTATFAETAEKLKALGEKMGLDIKMQDTDVFDTLHQTS